MLINKHENGLKHYNDPKTYIEYSNDIQKVYKNSKDYNPGKDRKVLIVFGDIIADIISNKKPNPIVTGLFVRGRKLNIPLISVTQSYFRVPKDRTSSTHYFNMKISNRRELQQIAIIPLILILKTL